MRRILLISVLGLSTLAFGADENPINLICISEQGTGFKYNKASDSWSQGTFNVENSKYIFTKYAGEFSMYKDKYTFTLLGKELPDAACGFVNEHGFGEDCSGINDLQINIETLRFQLIYPIGYVLTKAAIADGVQEGNTPMIEIGKCSKF